ERAPKRGDRFRMPVQSSIAVAEVAEKHDVLRLELGRPLEQLDRAVQPPRRLSDHAPEVPPGRDVGIALQSALVQFLGSVDPACLVVCKSLFEQLGGGLRLGHPEPSYGSGSTSTQGAGRQVYRPSAQ